MSYGWSKEFLEAGKKRLAGDTARAATSDEVKDLRREAQALKEVVASKTDCSKKHDRGWGRRGMRYSASDKTEINLGLGRSTALAGFDGCWQLGSAFPDRLSTAGMIAISAADRKLSPIALHGRIGSGTASQRLSAARLSTWRWINRN